jgi:ankyrin repeat protein
VFSNFPDVVELLLASGANPNARDENGGTPLHVAASCGSRSFVRSAPGGVLPLEMASEHSAEGVSTSVRMLKMLLAAGADRSAKRDDGLTPAGSASQWGHQEAVKMLSEGSAEA